MKSKYEKPKYLYRRYGDNKFFRGATFWKWTKNPREAAILDEGFWEYWGLREVDTGKNPGELVNVNDVDWV